MSRQEGSPKPGSHPKAVGGPAHPGPLRWVAAGCVVGLAATGQDVANASQGLGATADLLRPALVINATSAVVLGLLFALFSGLVAGPLRAATQHVLGRWGLRIALSGLIFFPFLALNRNLLRPAFEAMIAPNVTQTVASPVPPSLGYLGLAAGAIGLSAIIELTCRRGRLGMCLAVFAGAGALVLAWLNSEVLPFLYPRQHFACSLGAAILLLLAVGRAVAGLDNLGSRKLRAALIVAVVAFLGTAGARLEMSVGQMPPDVVLRLKYRALNSTACLRLVDFLSDWDGDGYSGLFAGGDCAPHDGSRSPGIAEIPGDGIDQNCLAGDPSPQDAVALRHILAGGGLHEDGTRAQSVLVLTLESVRADIALPAIEAILRGRCSRFANAYAARPSTASSMLAMFNSRYPVLPFSETTLNAPTVAELLAGVGFDTAAFVYSPNVLRSLSVTADIGPKRGFETLWFGESETPETALTASAETVDATLAWYAERSDNPRPFLLWVHLFNPHSPYQSHGGADHGTAAERYADEVAYTDAEAARLIRGLGGEEGLAIVVTADHGEAFGEHNTVHHNSTVYEEQIRVPLWICPAREPVVHPPVSLIDIAPTLLDLLGQEPPTSFTGRTLLLPERGPTPVFSLVEFPWGPVRAVIMGPWKLIAHRQDNVVDLYNLAEDPGETRDVSREFPDVRDDLLRLLDYWSVVVGDGA